MWITLYISARAVSPYFVMNIKKANHFSMMQLYKTLVDTTITFRKTMYSYLFWYIIVYKMAKNRSLQFLPLPGTK